MADWKLTAKQQMFVKEYLIDLNGSAAARRAGYSTKNSDDLSAQLLRKTHVASAIRIAMEDRAAKLDLTAEDVLHSILTIRGMAMAEKEFANALKANELLGKHLKLFTDKTELSGPGDGPIITRVELVAL